MSVAAVAVAVAGHGARVPPPPRPLRGDDGQATPPALNLPQEVENVETLKSYGCNDATTFADTAPFGFHRQRRRTPSVVRYPRVGYPAGTATPDITCG